MFRFFNSLLVKRCIRYVQFQHEPKNLINKIFTKIAVTATKTYIGAQISCAITSPIKTDKMDIGEVQKALYEGDAAIIKLMDELKDFVKVVSEEYRNCLKKQIEITEKSQNVGPFSDTWNELPKYRTLADELHEQLNNYNALFETLAKMVEIKSVDNPLDKDVLVKLKAKYKESQEIIKKELDENRKIEMMLLKLNCDTILMDVLTDSSQN